MERRTALKSLAVAAGGLISLPGWANGWARGSMPANGALLTTAQNELLAEFVEVIIPETKTPGAKSLGIHQFVERMVTDCYEPAAQESFKKGVGIVEEMAQISYGKPFVSCQPTQRNELVTKLSTSADGGQKGFYSLVKGLTIRGYMSSEYVMTNLTHYEFAPARYLGCVPVVSKAVSEKK
ncbi:gluconate 2-dehydrogenase subunit 3 family protein [Arsenicibacter rosenii]|uniref:gluconate 2-dehydrogenase subunit 3 family protein n=1 Tax=Arsenicibacter rosenii TaxID=1750698 RepID=UPI000A7FB742|nr:gluconate 2-dehydrogenase subunit 3 family protein [Arsenicibacter rosenii]